MQNRKDEDMETWMIQAYGRLVGNKGIRFLKGLYRDCTSVFPTSPQ